MDQCSSLLVSALFSTIILSGLYNPVEGNETMMLSCFFFLFAKFKARPKNVDLGLRLGEQFADEGLQFPRKPSQLTTGKFSAQ